MFICISGLASAADDKSFPDVSIGEELRKELSQSIGFCRSKEGPVDLENLLYLKNREIKEKSNGIISIIKIAREAIHIEKYDNKKALDQRIVLDVDADVAARLKEDDVDINIDFVLVDNDLAVFWKETYEHQPYRLGIYKIVDDDISFFCDGRGGVYKSH
jgi:hypothetical protein